MFRALFPCGSVTGAPKPSTMAADPGRRATPRGRVLRRDRRGRAAGRAVPGPVLRGDPDGADRPGTARDLRHRRRDHLGLRPDAEYAELLAKARVLDARPREFHLLETMRHEPGAGLRSLDATWPGWRPRPTYFGFRFDAAAVRTALATRLAGVGDARVRLRCYRDGTLGVDVEDLPARCRTGAPRDRPDADRLRRVLATPQDEPARAVHGPACAGTGGRRRGAGERARRGHRVLHGQPRGPAGRAVVDTPAGRAAACPGSSAPGSSPTACSTSGSSARRTCTAPRTSPWSTRCAAGGPRRWPAEPPLGPPGELDDHDADRGAGRGP